MSVLSYLSTRASNAVLTSTERSALETSRSTLATRLNSYFSADLTSHFRFGSSTRDTILPRKLDARSDIDYMIVFANGGSTPQTYLNRLRRFVTAYYSSSTIKQDHPTIRLDLAHITFDLVPALSSYYSGYQIPHSQYVWTDTDPTSFSNELQNANVANRSLLKPTIRLAKIWNAKAGYVYPSYELEQRIARQSFWFASNIRDYLFAVFDGMSPYEFNERWRRDRIERAKQIVENVRRYESSGLYPVTAEQEVKKLIQEFPA